MQLGGLGGCCKPIPVGAGTESQTISNFRLFEALKQALEDVKTVAYNLIKNLGKNYEIRLKSTSFQSKTHLQKHNDSNLFILQKKHTRKRLNSSTDIAFQRLREYKDAMRAYYRT